MDKIISLLNAQEIRFILVGGLNTLFGYGLFAFLITIGLHYTYAMLITTCVGILFNFKTTGVLVFKNHNNRLLFRFAVFYGIIYFINIGFLYAFNLIINNLYISGVISIGLTAVLSFLCSKYFIFE